jgi:hypothetical protein
MENTWLYFSLIKLGYAALKQFVIKMRVNRANGIQVKLNLFHQELPSLISISISFEIIHAPGM